MSAASSGITLATPLERLVTDWPTAAGRRIALSLSGSSDALSYGGSQVHQATMAHDLALYLLFTGHRLVYGGVLGHGGGGRARSRRHRELPRPADRTRRPASPRAWTTG
jgi:hypothetical protein